MSSSGDSEPPAWSVAFYSLLHPVQLAVVEAFRWIEEPLSAPLLYEVLERDWPSGTVGYHVSRLARHGVLEERFTEPRRGARERYYSLAR